MGIARYSKFMGRLRKAQNLKMNGLINKTTSNNKIIELVNIKKKKKNSPAAVTVDLTFALGFRSIKGTRMADFIETLLKGEDLRKFGGMRSTYLDILEVNNGVITESWGGRAGKRKIIQLNKKALNRWFKTGIIKKSNKKQPLKL